MSGVNVELESIKRVRHGLLAISLAFSKGCFDAEKLSKDRILSSVRIGENLSGALSRIKNAIERKKRDLEIAEQAWHDYEQEKKKNCNPPMPYSDAKFIQEQIEKLKAIQRKGEEIEQKYNTSYKKVADRIGVFINEFRKYSLGADASGEDVQTSANNLSRMISNLDRYARTNFSSSDVASYNAVAQQMNQQYQNFMQDQRRPIFERSFGDDDSR